MLKSLKQWLFERKLRKQAFKALSALFNRPDLNTISSLRRDHLGRAVLLGLEHKEGKVKKIRFGILRHPKPLRVPGLHHKVIEIYLYDVETGSLKILDSYNVTRKGKKFLRSDGQTS